MTAKTMVLSSPSKKGGLRGPRPHALKVSSSPPPSYSSSTRKNNSPGGGPAPVIVYEHTPKVVHARPHEFMSVVQRLTGKLPASPASLQEPLSSNNVHVAPVEERSVGGDPLMLTLGQHRAPSPMAAGQLMSPGGFFFSPNTMQFIQGLSPMF